MCRTKRWIVCVACGNAQQPLIKAARRRGYSIIGIDKEMIVENVDIHIKISTYSTKEVIKELTTGKYPRFEGVICRSSSKAVSTANKIASIYNLPRPGDVITGCSLSKLKLHEILTELCIPTIETKEADYGLLNTYSWNDCVIKPAMPEKGKENVYRVSGGECKSKALKKAAEESLDGRAVIQPYVEGEDITMVTVCSRGEMIWKEYFRECNKWVNGKVSTSGTKELREEIETGEKQVMINYAERIIKKSNASGYVFFTYRFQKGKEPLIYEINPGLCGDEVAEKLLPLIKPNIDFFDLDILIMTENINHENSILLK